ncbi:polysaccharide deacetylase family sporulation protein PdaB [Halobacillus alkaliphilus]|uniref:Polysaccharide deacetylase family sporulation protein PdaB n=1 Tax=Halobacillus alkaliphilus TaxID=396056 RepID=A0A1I2JSQ3_9BACI|nr:polysaccharide deacetylase family protein [Halobacillus alkaliphilus]SFF57138.1 polysaccharide deacetylase family sporulation protein PdaB [Halobacillus alkaliphilus]
MLDRIFVLLAATLLSLMSFTTLSSAHPAHYPLQTEFPDHMLYQGQIEGKMIALTFDDGPDQQYTPEILDILNEHKVKATFFLMGSRVVKHPDVTKRIVNEGHAIGNHTYWHPNLAEADIHQMEWEINHTNNQIYQATGKTTQWFRAPYGALNQQQVLSLGFLGYKGIGWSIDTEDWKGPGKKAITRQVINNVHPGAIILMHNAGHWTQDLSGTAESLDELIPLLKRNGYQFVTIPQMWQLNHHGQISSKQADERPLK